MEKRENERPYTILLWQLRCGPRIDARSVACQINIYALEIRLDQLDA
jgi:hypothetical protein